ncbi:hypothetical protein GCM10010472_71390 [Pseudonocardia halophobica]|uniref:UDP-glucose/GDP-mannose dehydrogenase N-terminal domain-containing protein n=1 Tax=Pseudonocardia halophobica TaxID=29401 RepID=A0A9W6L4L3_9PSEU|nr:hypothetical protein GCM10017577_21300 [Pseudonocardia halophobica]
MATGRAPFFEPEFEELLTTSLGSGRLRFSSDLAEAAGCQIHFVCVGTPQKRGEYAADLQYVEVAVEWALTPDSGHGLDYATSGTVAA